jgi:hypothetical protein
MLPRKSNLLAVLLFAVSLVAGTRLFGQDFDLEQQRVTLAEIHGFWRFHTGDDPRWADPNFDDSHWELLRSDQDWAVQGHKDYGGLAWYRFILKVPGDGKQLALLIPRFLDSYQLFADGELIGQFGGMPPHQRVRIGPPQLFVLPGNGSQRVPHAISIALRVWRWPYAAPVNGGGPQGAALIGEKDRIEEARRDAQRWAFWRLGSNSTLLLINLVAGFAALCLFWLRRTEYEYLWFGLSELLNAVVLVRIAYIAFYEAWFVPSTLLYNWAKLLSILCFLLFLLTLLKVRKDWLFWTAVASIAFEFVISPLHFSGFLSFPLTTSTWVLALLPSFIWMVVVLLRGARQKLHDARLLLVPVSVALAAYMFHWLALTIISSGRTSLTFSEVILLERLTDWPFPISIVNITDFAMQLSVLSILLMRFARTRRDEQRMGMELESARTVQRVLIPTEVPTVPGFSIASVYRPATQVGGDFFQTIPTKDGGVLIVIGDVSGKGMPAAMTVSLLVGTIRTLAHYTQSPGEILAAMNMRMLARSAGGFTTCLVLRADPHGALTIANAGHIEPLVNGVEMPLKNALPLGLSADSAYAESNLHLALNEQLTLMTDGVVEARNNDGELFGFERAAAIASKSAESIAADAQAFGQEDDITVVTLKRISAPEPIVVRVGQSAIAESPS